MLKNIQITLCAVFMALSLLVPAPASAADAGISKVADQARFWEKRGRYDLANDAWKKVLKVDPDNTEALTALGANKAGAGDSKAAKQYLERLQEADPSSAGVKRIENNLVIDEGDKDTLAKARRLSQNKKYEDAVKAYRSYFNGRQPSGRLGLEYYQTLAGTAGGWEEAKQGLKRLQRDNPNDLQYQLAYAEHLTYREKSRREGIAQLAKLEQHSAVAAPARAARRQALVWLNGKRSDLDLYRNYLSQHPKDSAVRKRLTQIQSDTAARQTVRAEAKPRPRKPAAPPPLATQDALVKQGFQALDNNKLDEAESLFRRALNIDANNSGALGGIGIIRLRTEHFEEAKQLLVRASQAQPKTAARWKDALASARFWSIARDAQRARESGHLQQAADLYKNALARMPDQTVVRVSYADTLSAAGELDAALSNYQRALREDPGNSAAQRGIVNVLSQQGKNKEALAFAEQIPASERGQITGLSNLRAQSLRKSAQEATAHGDLKQAETLLRNALALDPDSSYTRLDLARLYRKMGENDKAKSLVDGLLASEGDLPDALYIKALILAEDKKWWDGLQVLQRVPVRERSQAMTNLQKRLWIRYQTERAVAFAREGQIQGAQQILTQVADINDNDPEALGALAQAYAEAGNPQRAVTLMRQALSQSSDPSPGLRLQYAGLLSQLGQNVEFGVQLDALRQLHGQLTPEQRKGLSQLEAGNAIRQADQLREKGRFADAYEYLRPHLEANPDDPSLLMALARLYGDFKEPDKALDIYYDLLEDHPNDLNTYDGAIRAAIDAGRTDEAQYLVDHALNIAPANPRFYVLAGRLARARGDDDQAVSLFKQALALDAENSAQGLGPGGKEEGRAPLYLIGDQRQQQADTNPFGAPRALRYEDQNRPIGPRSPVGSIPPAGFRRSGAAGANRYSLPSEHVRDKRIIRQKTAPQRYRVPESQPTQYRRPQPQQSPVPAMRYQPRAQPRPRSERPVAKVQIPPNPRYFQQAQQPNRLVRRRLDGPLRPEALPRSKARSTPRGELIGEIADIESAKSNWAAGGLNLRTRDGESGLGELQDIEIPIEGSLGQIGPGRIRARVIPVFLNSGTLRANSAENFGLLPIAEASDGADPTRNTPATTTGGAADQLPFGDYDQSESGVAIGLVYELKNWRIDVGTSPLGFPEENFVGGIQWSPTFDNVLLNLDISRRSVTDSLLSYAGTRDPFLSGQAGKDITFGGVTRNGGRADLAYDLGDYGVYANVGGYFITGEQVEDNSQIEIGGGYYQHLWRRPNNQFTVGLNVTTFFYDKNLSGFTLGQGGYFSPQFYASVGIPVEWVGRQSRFSYRVGGAAGIQSFSEDDSDVFPGNFGGAQTKLETLAAAAGSTLNIRTRQQGDNNTGLGFNLYGAGEYLLTPHLSLGASGSFDNAKDFDQLAIGAYIRYWFRPQRPDRLPPPRTLAPFYVGDPSW